jgi:hypothetical protein
VFLQLDSAFGQGLLETARIEDPPISQAGLEPMYGGFLQRGVRDLIVWRRPQSPQIAR